MWASAEGRLVKILHLLDHSLPLQSGYSFRTIGILSAQRKRGWETVQMTTPKQYRFDGAVDLVDGWTFYRTLRPSSASQKLPVIRELSQMWASRQRLDQVIERIATGRSACPLAGLEWHTSACGSPTSPPSTGL